LFQHPLRAFRKSIIKFAILIVVNLQMLIKENLFLILIVILASILRFLWLDRIPVAISLDELTYVLNAKVMSLYWTDLTQTWNPLSIFFFNYPPFTTPQAELPYFILAPFVGLFELTLLTVRLPFAALSVCSVILIYLITKRIWSQKAALLAAFVAAINPWFIFVGRTAYEVSLSSFLFLLSFYLLLVLKGRTILLSIPVLFLAFYSYIGTKVSFLPFAILVVYFAYLLNKKKYTRSYLTVLAACFVLLLVFVLVSHGGERAESLININSKVISEEVNSLRQITITSPLKSLFENKYTVFVQILTNKLIDSFSFNYLFIRGDGFFANMRHGFLYIIDLPFLILGTLFIFTKNRKLFYLLVSLLLVGVLPHLVYREEVYNFVPHISLMLALLPIIIGIGIFEFLVFFRQRKLYLSSIFIVGTLYLLYLFNFLNVYFYQFPLLGHNDFNERILSKYISLAKEKGEDVTIYSPQSHEVFKRHIFYSKSLNYENLSAITEVINYGNYSFQNVRFEGCDNTIVPLNSSNIIAYDYICGPITDEEKHVTIPRLVDGGESIRIYNDKVCASYKLKPFPIDIKISDFAVEQMGERGFCETFITSF